MQQTLSAPTAASKTTPTRSSGSSSRALSAVKFVLANFGPFLAFWVAAKAFGLMAGIAAAVAVTVIEVAYRLARREKLTRLFKLSAALVIAFGAVDLCMHRSVLFRMEAAVISLIFAGYFGASLFGPKTVIEEVHERTKKPGDPAPPETRSYLRLLTKVWFGYFVAKAVLYAYMGVAMQLEDAMAIRAVIGPASFFALLLGEQVVRRRLFGFLRDRGIIRATVETAPNTQVPCETPAA